MFNVNVKIISELKEFVEIVCGDRRILETFCLSDEACTRNRKLPFGRLVLLISKLCKKTLSVELEGFFENMGYLKLIGGSVHDDCRSVNETPDGGYILAGSSNSSLSGTHFQTTSNGSSDFYIAKLTSDGTLQWQKLYGGDKDDQAWSIGLTVEGGFIVAGHSLSSNTGYLISVPGNGAYYYDWLSSKAE